MTKTVKRLYAGFRPEQYEIELTPNPDTMTLSGVVTITGQKVGRPSERLTFHQNGLRVLSAEVERIDKKGARTFPITRINHHQTLNEVRLHAGELLYPGQYRVRMTFEGKVHDTLHGLYRCNYDLNGEKRALVATQFESHFAREAFPCIDEPEAKAVFTLTLLTPEQDVVLSNTPAKQTATAVVGSRTLKKTTFNPTPRMSSYLLAFVFGDLQSKTATTKHGTEVAVWATKAHDSAALDFGLDVAVRAIEFFNDYYGVPYPLAKCDHVALPDFAAGAMENWGLITYRETCLLADPATASQSARERVALVVAHELSHQWFGDLVTMKWWNDLWLNESFANVMEYLAVNALFPEWHVWDTFVADEGLAAIRRDCLDGVQAINTTVHHPDEISTLFDPSIVYAKGGRLLNMLRQFIGEDDFRKGLKSYFEKHAYANTAGDDLWAALSTASGKDIASFMKPWLAQPGFPLVDVAQDGTSLQIAQSHFVLDVSKSDPTRHWTVPLFADNSSVPALLDKTTMTLTLPSDDFVRVNANALGHYIVRYNNPAHAVTIAQLASQQKLSAVERLMLLSDSALLARAGRHSFAETLKLMGYYDAEDSEPVWDILALTFGDARRFIDVAPELEEALKTFARQLVEKQYQRLGWAEVKGESSADTKLRAIIIALGAYGEHQAITAEALTLFEAYKKDAGAISSELRSIVFGVAVRTHALGAFEYLLQLDEQTNDVNLKQDILGALVGTRRDDEAKTLLGRLTDANKVRPQDFDHWLVYLLRNRFARQQSWAWLQANWSWVEQTFKGDQSYDNYPRYVASAFSTDELLASYKAFFEPKADQPALTRNIAMGIEEIATRAAWLKRDLASVKMFFEEKE